MIFVFGSNLDGIHGKGAALYARKYLDAEIGIGEGITGKCYALPTKGHRLSNMTVAQIKDHVDRFIEFANYNKHLVFKVTQVGCGLGGHSAKDIAPLFLNAPKNCYFDKEWSKYLGEEFSYWGTHK